jgi:hypothetical protein
VAYRGGELDARIMHGWVTPLHVAQRLRPVRTGELGRKASSPELLEQTHVQVNGLWIPKENVRDAALVSAGAQAHPRGLAYELDALTRARLCHLRYPHRVMSGWTAAAAWGMDCFVDDADTTVLSGGARAVAASAAGVTRRRRTRALARIPTYRIDPEFPDLQVTAPVLTLIHCLQSLWSGEHSWAVPTGTGLTDTGTQAVQLVDAMCRTFGIDPAELPEACAHHLGRSRMELVTGWCDRGGESPMETLMRLMVRKIMTGTGRVFSSQMVVHADGTVSDPVHGGATGDSRIVARLDLGCEELKLALQYDGSGHLHRSVRDRDSRINAELANLDWHVVRVTKGHLDDAAAFRTVLRDAVGLCERRLAAREDG